MIFDLDIFTIVACGVIFAAFIAAWIYIATTGADKLPGRKKWIDQLPSIISTLGVLGTFIGITKGLIAFDPGDLVQSIPKLLEGLKTAFFTSLVGMAGSLILNRIVSAKFDKQARGSEIENAARMVTDAINASHGELPRMMEDSNKHLMSILSQDGSVRGLRQDIRQLKEDVDELKSILQGLYSAIGGMSRSLNGLTDIEQLKDDVEELKGVVQELNSAAGEAARSLGELPAVTEELSRLRAVAVTSTASVSAIDNNIEDMCSTLSTVADKISEISDGKE